MIRPILVTGASGFLGSHVVTELYKAGLGSRVHLMLRSEPQADSLLGLRFRDRGINLGDIKPRLHFADLTDGEKFNSVLAELKNLSREWIVIHLAAIINAKGDELAQEQVNFERTRELMEWTNENGARFIYTSSIVAFGGSPVDKVRSEENYGDYHWLNRLDGYSRSKRKAHDSVLANSKVATVVLCPGIIHGAYENRKSSRAHLEVVLRGRVRWVPGGVGAFASLSTIGEKILEAATSEKFDSGVHVKLLNDICLNYVEYFQLYRDCAKKEKIVIRSFPTCLVYLFAMPYYLLRMIGIKAPILGKIIQALLNYDFKIDRSFAEGKNVLRVAIEESFSKRG